MKTIQEMIAVMQAYEDGKEIEYTDKYSHIGCWLGTRDPVWNWCSSDYRVKQAPEYVPFTFEDADFLIGKIVSSKKEQYKVLITECDEESVQHCTYEELLNNWTFLDNSPCGKIK